MAIAGQSIAATALSTASQNKTISDSDSSKSTSQDDGNDLKNKEFSNVLDGQSEPTAPSKTGKSEVSVDEQTVTETTIENSEGRPGGSAEPILVVGKTGNLLPAIGVELPVGDAGEAGSTLNEKDSISVKRLLTAEQIIIPAGDHAANSATATASVTIDNSSEGSALAPEGKEKAGSILTADPSLSAEKVISTNPPVTTELQAVSKGELTDVNLSNATTDGKPVNPNQVPDQSLVTNDQFKLSEISQNFVKPVQNKVEGKVEGKVESNVEGRAQSIVSESELNTSVLTALTNKPNGGKAEAIALTKPIAQSDPFVSKTLETRGGVNSSGSTVQSPSSLSGLSTNSSSGLEVAPALKASELDVKSMTPINSSTTSFTAQLAVQVQLKAQLEAAGKNVEGKVAGASTAALAETVSSQSSTSTYTALSDLSTAYKQPQNVSAQVSVPIEVGKPGWSDGVMAKVMWMSSQQISKAEIALDPPELGPLQVRISTQADQTSVVFTSSHGAVREALDLGLPRLREMMENQGLDLSDVDVSDQRSFGTESQGEDSAEEGMLSQRGDTEADESGENSAEVTGNIVNNASLSLVDHYV